MVKFAATAIALAATLASQTASGAEILLLDFASPHCPPCRQMDPLIQSFVSASYPIRKIDVTREQTLAHQYNVTRVPCFVMLADGQEVDRVVGATSQERIQAMFRRAQEEVNRRAPDIRGISPEGTQPPVTPQANIPWEGVPLAGAHPSGTNDLASNHATSPAASDSQRSTLDPRLLNCSVRLRVEDGQGRSFGTGTIIDARSGEALVITCGHIFRDSKGEGPVTVEIFESTPAGPRGVGQLAGKVISYDLDRDIGLVSIRPDRPVAVAPVAPVGSPLDRGDRVTSVGCNNGDDPTIMATRVTSLASHQNPPNTQAAGAPVEGRSGGGLFNEQGELVGVCFAADYEGKQGLYASLDSIHNELDKIGLSEIYGKPVGNAVEGDSIAVETPAAPEVVRGQEPPQPITPIGAVAGATVAIDSQASSQAAPANLNAAEQAALEEILTRAATSEVICIIRPKDAAGQSEVITLDQVSPEFVRALAARRKQSPATAVR